MFFTSFGQSVIDEAMYRQKMKSYLLSWTQGLSTSSTSNLMFDGTLNLR